MSDNIEESRFDVPAAPVIPKYPTVPAPPAVHEAEKRPTTVNALIDKLVFCECFKEIEETEIKVWRNIKCIEKCFVEVIDKDIYCSREKGAWVVIITCKLIIVYVTEYGFEHKVIKTVAFRKCIPFPLTEKHEEHEKHGKHEEHEKYEEHGMIDFEKAFPCLMVDKAECIDIKFKNIDCNAFIKAIVELDYKVLATIRKAYNLLSVGHGC